jgi:hypothetical protein
LPCFGTRPVSKSPVKATELTNSVVFLIRKTREVIRSVVFLIRKTREVIRSVVFLIRKTREVIRSVVFLVRKMREFVRKITNFIVAAGKVRLWAGQAMAAGGSGRKSGCLLLWHGRC